MTYHDAYMYSDAVESGLFEGNPTKHNWTQPEIDLLSLTQKSCLTLPFTAKARKLLISKLFSKPVEEVKQGPNKYRLYSAQAHDTQVANILTVIQPARTKLHEYPN